MIKILAAIFVLYFLGRKPSGSVDHTNIYMFILFLYCLILLFTSQSTSFLLCREGSSSTKQGLVCLVQWHNAVTPVRLQPATHWSRVKLSTTVPLRSITAIIYMYTQGHS